jgi:hypothetical protein
MFASRIDSQILFLLTDFAPFISHLTECYNHTIEVRKGLTRYKHWFQHDNETKYPHDTLVLAQFRSPYDWFKAMEHVPHHAPAHLRTKPGASTDDHSANNDWKIFMTKPWTMPRYGADLQLKGDEMCQEDFLYRDIVSCVEDPLPEDYYKYTLRYSENQPFYEMRNDGSGLPYNNIMELRTDKIRNFLNTVNYNGVSDVWTLQYEYLVSIGTQHLLDRITEWTGVQPTCKAIAPQVRKPKGSRMIRADFAAHIRENLNWTVEKWIGYSPELKYEQAPSQWRRRQLRQSTPDVASNVALMDDEAWNDYEFNDNDDDEFNYEEE